MSIKRFARIKNRVFRGGMISISCISIALLLSAVVLVRDIRGNREAELEAVRDIMKKQTNQLIDTMNKINGIEFSLVTDSLWTVPYFANADRETVEADMIDTNLLPNTARGNPIPFAEGSIMYRVVTRVKTLIQSTPLFDTLVLYAPKSDCYVGSMREGMYNFAAFGNEEVRRHIQVSQDQWEKLIQNNTVAFAKVNAARGVDDKLIFSHKLNNGLVAIFILTYEQYEKTLLSGNYGNLFNAVGFALNIDESGGLYWNSQEKWYVNPDDFFGLGFMDWNNAPSIFEMSIDSKIHTVMQVKASEYNLRYIAVLENKPSLIINSKLFTPFLIFSCLWFFAMLICCLFLFREWYQPIEVMAKQLPGALSKNASKDQYAQVSFAIQQLIKQTGESDIIIKKQDQMLFNASLLQILLGDNDISNLDEKTRNSLNDLCQRFMVFVLCPSENAHWSGKPGDEQELEYYDSVIPLTVQDLLKEKLAPYTVICMRHQNQLIMVVSDSKLEKETTEQCVYDGVLELRKQLSIDILIYQSGILSGLTSAITAYQSALFALPHVFGEVKENAQIPASTGRDQLQMELRMVNMIYVEDYERAFLLFQEIVDSVFQQKKVPALLASQISGLIGRTYSILIESNVKNKEILDQTFLLAHSINLVNREQLLALWKSVFLFLRKSNVNSQDYSILFSRIFQYFLDHYREDSMSLSVLAEKFDLSMPTISREFQKNTGMGFLDCLHRMRIEAAKKEMADATKSIKDIAESVGYTNVLTMTRAFKKYEGTTPGAFRKDSAPKKSLS